MAVLKKIIQAVEVLYQRKETLNRRYNNKKHGAHYQQEYDSIMKALKVREAQLNNVGKGDIYLVKLRVNPIHIFEYKYLILTGMDEQEIQDWATFKKMQVTSMTKFPDRVLLDKTQYEEFIKQLTLILNP